MPTRNPPETFYNLPTSELMRRLRPPSLLRDYMDFFTWDKTKLLDEQFDKSLDTTRWAVANSGGAGASNFAIPGTQVVGGVAQGATGTTANGSISMIGPLIYKGSANCGMLAIVSLDVSTNVLIDVGFIAAVPGSNNPAFNNYDTPTAFATNAACVTINTGASTNKALGFYTVTGGDSSVYKSQFTGVTGFTNNKYFAIQVSVTPAGGAYAQVRQLGAGPYGSISGGYIAASNFIRQDAGTGGTNKTNIDATVLLAPWFYCQTLNTTTHKPQIERCLVWQDLQV